MGMKNKDGFSEKMSFNACLKIDSISLKQCIRAATIPSLPRDKMLDSACVFLLVFGEEYDRHILAIQKSDTKGYPWRNQVALPGGHVDPKDKGPEETAFRELVNRYKNSLYAFLRQFLNQQDLVEDVFQETFL